MAQDWSGIRQKFKITLIAELITTPNVTDFNLMLVIMLIVNLIVNQMWWTLKYFNHKIVGLNPITFPESYLLPLVLHLDKAPPGSNFARGGLLDIFPL